MTISRSQQLLKNTWDLSPLYSTLEQWTADLAEESKTNYEILVRPLKEKNPLSPEQVLDVFKIYFSTDRQLKKLYTWAHLFHDQDTANDEGKQALQKILSRYHDFTEAFSWIEPTILSHSEEQLTAFARAPILKEYVTILERLVRLKKHTLSADKEALVAMAGRALDATHKSFSALNDADLHFGTIQDSEKISHPLTHASYGVHIRSTDRTLRKNAFESMHMTYEQHENTLSELLYGTIQRHQFDAKAHSYSSCLEAALFPNNIPTSIYHNLIKTVRDNISLLHDYIRLKKESLKLEDIYPWDLYVPIVTSGEKESYTYERATEAISKALAPLGKEYVSRVLSGITHSRWVDRFENENKRSGAYSSGCYDSPPYILMNYKNQLRDVFTLAHEAGHSMHSDLSRAQPYHYSNYCIFVAEVASTFNEELLSRFLLQDPTLSDSAKAFLIHEKLEDIRATLFRQTLFAEFELFLHERVERGEPMTPVILREKFLELNRFYYGPELTYPAISSIEWSRIPHFYYNYYVYQYATGISAAMALADRVANGGNQERTEYLQFLQSGNSLFPVDALRLAGVDMEKPEPIERAVRHFGELATQLRLLLKIGS